MICWFIFTIRFLNYLYVMSFYYLKYLKQLLWRICLLNLNLGAQRYFSLLLFFLNMDHSSRFIIFSLILDILNNIVEPLHSDLPPRLEIVMWLFGNPPGLKGEVCEVCFFCSYWCLFHCFLLWFLKTCFLFVTCLST